MVEHLLRDWDGEGTIIRFDRATGSWIVVAIHSTTLGAAIGGTRMKPYPDLSAAVLDAQRLATGMTYKWAAAGLDAGGGKAVIAVPPDLDPSERTGLLQRYATLVGSLRGLYFTGPDSGTTSEDMDLIDGIADGLAFCRSLEAGGSGNPAVFTSLGVFTAIGVVAERCFGSGSLAGVGEARPRCPRRTPDPSRSPGCSDRRDPLRRRE